MSRLSSPDMETPEGQPTSSTESVELRNGTPGDSGKADAKPANADAAQDASRLDRVEELMDQIGKKVGAFTSTFGQRLFRAAAHAREAAEDIWAEAQSIRRGEPQQEHPDENPPA